MSEIRRFLNGQNVTVRVQPVFDPSSVVSVDRYEIPTRIAEAVRLRDPVEVFPFGSRRARTPWGVADLDHTVPYVSPDRGGLPGQTGPANLGPLSRHHHRAKTHAGWSVWQPQPGVFVWRAPRGHVYTVDSTGTRAHGRGPYAAALWLAVSKTSVCEAVSRSSVEAAA